MYNKPNEKLLVGCVTILEKYSKSVHHHIRLLPDESFYSLSCKEPIIVGDNRNNLYNVAKFASTNSLGFNFALKFNLETMSAKKVKYILTDANIKVFHLNDSFSQLIFRAEFATNKTSTKHAQPHWQFEPYIIRALKEDDFNTILDLRHEENEIIEIEPNNDYFNMSKIHFSMNSDWCKSKREQTLDSQVVSITEENVITWLDGCMGYISEQIK